MYMRILYIVPRNFSQYETRERSSRHTHSAAFVRGQNRSIIAVLSLFRSKFNQSRRNGASTRPAPFILIHTRGVTNRPLCVCVSYLPVFSKEKNFSPFRERRFLESLTAWEPADFVNKTIVVRDYYASTLFWQCVFSFPADLAFGGAKRFFGNICQQCKYFSAAIFFVTSRRVRLVIETLID